MKEILRLGMQCPPPLELGDRFVVDEGCVQRPHSGLTSYLKNGYSLSLSVSHQSYSGKL